MADPMQCQVHEKENALYVCLEGDLDEGCFPTLSRALSGRSLEHPVKVDLQGVSFADSAGLRGLVLMQRQARNAGVPFTVLDPSKAVRRVLRSTGLDELFNIAADDPDDPC